MFLVIFLVIFLGWGLGGRADRVSPSFVRMGNWGVGILCGEAGCQHYIYLSSSVAFLYSTQGFSFALSLNLINAGKVWVLQRVDKHSASRLTIYDVLNLWPLGIEQSRPFEGKSTRLHHRQLFSYQL